MNEEQRDPAIGEGLDEGQEERVAHYLLGAMEAGERKRFEEEILRSDALAEAVYAQLAVGGALHRNKVEILAQADAAAPGEAGFPGAASRELESAGAPWWKRPRFAWGIPAAAAALLAVFLLFPRGEDAGRRTPVWRGDVPAVEGMHPSGMVAELPERFTWTPDPAAGAYRFQLFDAEGRPLFQIVVREPGVEVPEGLRDRAAGEGLWRVTPLDASGVELPAPPPVRYRVRER